MKIKFEKDTVFLVTGGAGFIGANICDAILKMGHAVRCLDNFSAGLPKNIAPFIENPLFELVQGDIRDYETCQKACDGADFVLHQAALSGARDSIEMPLIYEETNIRGTLNMLEAARNAGVCRFVYATAKEGDFSSPYALTKLVNEQYAALYTNLYGLETVGLRYFNAFGPLQNPNSPHAAVIPRFITALLDGQVPTIYGDGTQSRNFTYIDNIIEANLRACLASPECAGEVFGIASSGQETLLSLYDTLCKALEVDIKPNFAPPREGDIMHSNADISKAKKMLNYNPLLDFAEGIKLSVQWYKNTLRPEDA